MDYLISLMKDHRAIVEVTINGKSGKAMFDRVKTNLVHVFELRLQVNGHVPMLFDCDSLQDVARIMTRNHVAITA